MEDLFLDFEIYQSLSELSPGTLKFITINGNSVRLEKKYVAGGKKSKKKLVYEFETPTEHGLVSTIDELFERIMIQ